MVARPPRRHERLLADLAAVLPRTVEFPDGTFGWVPRVEAVLEGHARDATIDDVRIPVHSADAAATTNWPGWPPPRRPWWIRG